MRGRHCSRCHHRTNEGNEANLNEEAMVEEATHSSHGNSGQIKSITNERNNVPLRGDINSASTAFNASISDETDTTSSVNNIPIPIFKSSQYSIQRQKNLQGKRCSNYAEHRLFPTKGGKYPRNTPDALHSPPSSGSRMLSHFG